MALPFTVVPLRGVPPRLTWYWNAETRTQIGRFPVSLGTGLVRSVELDAIPPAPGVAA